MDQARSVIFSTLLPFQLWGSFRRRHAAVHRVSGRIVFGLGTFATVSVIALPSVMPARPLGERTFVTRFAVVFLVVLTRTVLVARRRAFAEHRRWAIWMVTMPWCR